MECNKRAVCNVCEATFGRGRGCVLEKRCPACRFLGLVEIKGNPFEWSDSVSRLKISKPIRSMSLCIYDESELIQRYGEYDCSIRSESKSVEDEVLSLDESEKIWDILSLSLSNREMVVIKNRFGLNEVRSDYTLEEIGKMINATRERVRHIEYYSLLRLKENGIIESAREFILV